MPRAECPTHGVVQTAVPWAIPGWKFTLLFERLAIDWVREAAVTAVARQLDLGWDVVWGIERRAVARGLERRGTLKRASSGWTKSPSSVDTTTSRS